MYANGRRGAKGEYARYRPDFFTKQEVAEYPWVFKSTDASVYIIKVANTGNALELAGFVRSESREGMYYYVIVPLSAQNRKDIVGVGKCACESTNFYGRQCKHMLHMRNVYRRNMEQMDRLLRREEVMK